MPAQSELQRIASLRLRDRLEFEEIAKKMDISLATLKKWTLLSEYQDAVKAMRTQWRQDTRSRVAGLGDAVVDTLEELMMFGKGERIRLEAAQTLGEWIGLGQPEPETGGDDRDDLVSLLRQKLQAPPQVLVFAPPAAGGLLPEAFQAPRPDIIDALPIEKRGKEEKGEEKEKEE